MSERVTNGYLRLFEVRILHHYWLDDGATVFDKIASQAARDSRLLAYDHRPFLAVRPSLLTEKLLAAYRCLFKGTPLGFVVAAPASLAIPADTLLEFVVTVSDSRFFGYTALTLRPQRAYDIYYEPEKTTYRYKENVPLFSNLTGASRGAGAGKALFLSQEPPAPDASDTVEALVVSAGGLEQLTGDAPSATTQLLATDPNDLPVYVNQGDVPAITPPTGLLGAPAKGVRLSGDSANDVFAYLSLTAVRADDDSFSFVDAGG